MKKIKLNYLGKNKNLLNNPDKCVLDAIPNNNHNKNYIVRLTINEFTSLCPITGQPDFAKFIIDYLPNKFLVESKSFKFFMHSFRNHQCFHENCTIFIVERLLISIKAKWIRRGGYWYRRGGIPIDIFYETKKPPKNIYIPSTGIKPYKGR
ncbi:MAG: preQ(1) synthase [Alphaproteobacteria bacterium]|nr:preQ(1) synthase [Alphaproteobacteria bacterium]